MVERKQGDGNGAASTPRPPLPPHLDPRRKAPASRSRAGSRALPRNAPRQGPPGAPSTRWPVAQEVVPSRPPRRRRRAARILSWLAIATSVSVLAAAGGGYLILQHYDGKFGRLDNIFGKNRPPASAAAGAKNFLIVGSDTRDIEGGDEFQGRGAEFVTGQRSDTVILAHVYGGKSKQVQLVSFPRDSWVIIPEHVDPATKKTRAARPAKLNRAFFEGGPALLLATIENLTQVRIDHYVQINFQGFQGMVDRLGGVEVCLPKAAKDKFSGIDLPAGRHRLDGRKALSFVRQRVGTGISGGDIGRIQRQQQFMGSMVRKVLSAGTLLNPKRLKGFLDVATESVTVDEKFQIGDLRKLAQRLGKSEPGSIIFATVPVSDPNAYRQRQSVVLLDEAKSAELFGAIQRDQPPGAAPKPSAGASEPLIVAPENVRVRVFNGAGIQGLARRAAADLEGVGFKVVGTPESRGSGNAGTVILHGPGKADSARTLAAAIPGATISIEPTLETVLEVVVGSSYAGAKRPVIGKPSTGASPRASASPKVITAQDDPCAA
ncbi:MAG TPA: LCP family protein [Mycobacteriales bacterium]|nr:LCP family protein [Mycobacteriales bacterium]